MKGRGLTLCRQMNEYLEISFNLVGKHHFAHLASVNIFLQQKNSNVRWDGHNKPLTNRMCSLADKQQQQQR